MIPYLLSTVWNTQRGSRSSIAKRRGRKKIEVTRRRKRRVKGEREIKPLITLLSKNGY